MTIETLKTFSEADIQALAAAMKVGLVATVNPEGLPHLTLIASLQANTPTQMIFGQFTEGTSKQFIRENPKIGWLVMTLDRQLWRGTAKFTHTATQGPEFEMYNDTSMFRYNAYFGVHTVYYLDLVAHLGRQALPTARVAWAALKTRAARALSGGGSAVEVLNPWTRALMNKLDNLKFVAYVGSDGYPVVIPTIQAQAADAERVLFSTSIYGDTLAAIPSGAAVAVFGMSLQMETVLLRGEFEGIRRVGGVRCGSIRLNWVYNPMPPKPQQIYPPVPLKTITSF